MLTEAQHDAEFIGLHAEQSGKTPDHENGEQRDRYAKPAEITARQKLLHTVLGAAEKIFEVGRPWPPAGRLWSGAPRSLRTRTPGTSALILPRHTNLLQGLGGPLGSVPR